MKRIQNPKHEEFRLNREFSKLRILDRESNKISKPKGWRIRNQQKRRRRISQKQIQGIQNPRIREFSRIENSANYKSLDRESKKQNTCRKDRESEISNKGDRESHKNKFKGYRIQELENLAE